MSKLKNLGFAILNVWSFVAFAADPIPREKLKQVKTKCDIDYIWVQANQDPKITFSQELISTGARYDDDGQVLSALYQTLPQFMNLYVHVIHVLTGPLNTATTVEPAYLSIYRFDGEGNDPKIYFSKDYDDLNLEEKITGMADLPSEIAIPNFVNRLGYSCSTSAPR